MDRDSIPNEERMGYEVIMGSHSHPSYTRTHFLYSFLIPIRLRTQAGGVASEADDHWLLKGRERARDVMEIRETEGNSHRPHLQVSQTMRRGTKQMAPQAVLFIEVIGRWRPRLSARTCKCKSISHPKMVHCTYRLISVPSSFFNGLERS